MMIHSNTVNIFLAHSGTRRFGSASHTNFKLCVHCILKLSGISARKTEPVTAGADAMVYTVCQVSGPVICKQRPGVCFSSSRGMLDLYAENPNIFGTVCAEFGIMLGFKCVTTASSAQRTYNILFIHCPKNIISI